eukprot:m.420956 g.420956  ORF g.420956 m.420956 type:complete len:441 (+) comp20192_c0_seq10:1057-2379(+)
MPATPMVSHSFPAHRRGSETTAVPSPARPLSQSQLQTSLSDTTIPSPLQRSPASRSMMLKMRRPPSLSGLGSYRSPGSMISATGAAGGSLPSSPGTASGSGIHSPPGSPRGSRLLTPSATSSRLGPQESGPWDTLGTNSPYVSLNASSLDPPADTRAAVLHSRRGASVDTLAAGTGPNGGLGALVLPLDARRRRILEPRTRYGFLFRVVPTGTASQTGTSMETLDFSVTLTWSIPSLISPITCQYRMARAQVTEQAMVVTVNCPQPVYVGQVFDVVYSVANRTSVERDLALHLRRPQLVDHVARRRVLMQSAGRASVGTGGAVEDGNDTVGESLSNSSLLPRPHMLGSTTFADMESGSRTSVSLALLAELATDESGLVCLHKTVCVGSCQPATITTVSVQFEARLPGLYDVGDVKLFDRVEQSFLLSRSQGCQVYVLPAR